MASLEEIKHRFWDRESDYLVERPLTDAAVRAAEEKLGVRLPAAYIELLEVQNGGVAAEEFSAFPMSQPTSWSHDHVGFADMMGIGTGAQTILNSPYLTEEWEMPGELVLLTGDGHWWIALDYRDRDPGGEPPVVWYDNEVGEDVQLAPSFRAFVEGLRPQGVFEDEELAYDPERLPAADYATNVRSPLSSKIKHLREDLAAFSSGEQSLTATKAWLVARPAEVLVRLPRRKTKGLRSALSEIEAATGEQLSDVVEAVVDELEALMPRWLKLRDIVGEYRDAQYLRERGLG